MERRNLDMEIGLSEEQWEQVGRRAAELGPDEGGFAWDDSTPEPPETPVRVYLRDEDAPNLWRHRVPREEVYGDAEREIARFHYNGGRPFAEVVAPEGVDEPAYNDAEEHALQAELETWTRGKWRELMEESGLHYERGHVPQG